LSSELLSLHYLNGVGCDLRRWVQLGADPEAVNSRRGRAAGSR
jgi:hypothetical protein